MWAGVVCGIVSSRDLGSFGSGSRSASYSGVNSSSCDIWATTYTRRCNGGSVWIRVIGWSGRVAWNGRIGAASIAGINSAGHYTENNSISIST